MCFGDSLLQNKSDFSLTLAKYNFNFAGVSIELDKVHLMEQEFMIKKYIGPFFSLSKVLPFILQWPLSKMQWKKKTNANGSTLLIVCLFLNWNIRSCDSLRPKAGGPRLKTHLGQSNINHMPSSMWTLWQNSASGCLVTQFTQHRNKCKAVKYFDGSGVFAGPRLESHAAAMTNRSATPAS